ncbi:unnamed protein product [Prorocentrum cordatum]|uniref:Potassium channel tetramerisation-type BTB domain-containing protein n=1 Tax=Prorocentrum cordatum TaxID=2364126 RepID=A0ABN9TES3_9DINO|nr:unnamed protein product [Polarella glacialis]
MAAGLSSLEALKQKLAEDLSARAVSHLRAASAVGSEDGRCSAADADREASAIARRAVEAAVDTWPDGAGRWSGSGARSTTPRAQQPRCWPAEAAPEAAVQVSRRPSLLLAQAQVTPSAPSSPPAAQRPQPGRQARPAAAEQPAPPGPEGGGVDFESDPINFTHILRFMRDGEAWQPPDDNKARAALKKEAVYFGCTGILNRLDRDEVERAGIAIA